MLTTLLLVLAATAAAAPTANPDPNPDTLTGPRTYAIRANPSGEHSDDPATRFAWLQNEAHLARLKYADRLGLDAATIQARHKRNSRRDVRVKNWGASYSIQVDIGTPPQSFDTFIDTGSSDLWVVGRCQDYTECGFSKPFVASQSKSFVGTGKEFNITYIKGETLGEWVEDVVNVGGKGIRTLFGVADHVTEWATAQSALMGFGFQSASTGGVMPWWQAASTYWTDKRWGMYLARAADWRDALYNPTSQGGELTFGGVDRTKMAGEPSYYSLIGNQGLWTVYTQGLAINGTLLDSKTRIATTDSGTSVIMGPDAAVRAFYNAIDPNYISFTDGSYAFECGPGRPMGVSIAFGSSDFPGSGEPRLFDMWDGDLVYFSGTRAEYAAGGMRIPYSLTGERYCLGNIFSWNDEKVTDYWLVGSPFLRNVYSLYETKPVRHGLVPLAESANFKYGVAYNPVQAAGTEANITTGQGGPESGPHSPGAGGGEGTTTASGAGRVRVPALVIAAGALAWLF